MLLYRMTKLMEDPSRLKENFLDPNGDLAELALAKEQMESSYAGLMEEDSADWGSEANY